MSDQDHKLSDAFSVAKGLFFAGETFNSVFKHLVKDLGLCEHLASGVTSDAQRAYATVRSSDRETEREILTRQLEDLVYRQTHGYEEERIDKSGNIITVLRKDLKGATATIKVLMNLRGLSKADEDYNATLREAGAVATWVAEAKKEKI